jgi:hypothetical protein
MNLTTKSQPVLKIQFIVGSQLLPEHITTEFNLVRETSNSGTLLMSPNCAWYNRIMAYLSKFSEETSRISVTDCSKISNHISGQFQADLKQLQISDDLSSQLNDIYIPLGAWLAEKAKQQAPPDCWDQWCTGFWQVDSLRTP